MRVIKILAAITAAAALAVFFTSDAFAADRWSAAPRYDPQGKFQVDTAAGMRMYQSGNRWSSPPPARPLSVPQPRRSVHCTSFSSGGFTNTTCN